MFDQLGTQRVRHGVLGVAVVAASLIVAGCSPQSAPARPEAIPGTIADVGGTGMSGLSTTIPPSNSGGGPPPSPGSIANGRPSAS